MLKLANSKIILILLAAATMLSSCGANWRLSKEDRGNNKYKGHYKVGQTYEIKGNSYTPSKVTKYTKVGKASWYGKKDGFHGKKTANGDTYNKNMLTAAHRTLPMPSLVKITNMANKKSLIAMVNDRGPFSSKREIDVSEKVATLLDFKRQGTATVKVEYLHKDTIELIKNLGLKPKEGSKAKKTLATKGCSVNCHIKKVNMSHNKNLKISDL